MNITAKGNLSIVQPRMRTLLGGAVLFCALGHLQTAGADGGVTHTDIAANGSAGINYSREPSSAWSLFQDIADKIPTFTFFDVANFPLKSRGSPGTAVADFDGDGDLDIYVTNGPEAANSLFSSQLKETGQVTFINLGALSGAGAISQNSSGVCNGDIDNDGDQDLLVLGMNEPNILYRNNGNGTFTDITQLGSIGDNLDRGSTSCSFGDVNGDGLLDVAIANAWSGCITGLVGQQCGLEHQVPITVEPFRFDDHNELHMNLGGGNFVDMSLQSGILNTSGYRPPNDGAPSVTWAISLVDLDQDGDLDLVTGDDQGGIRSFEAGGVTHGILHIFENDGNGFFTDISIEAATDVSGAWMGLSFGDLNCDGEMDLFSTNIGDYARTILPNPAKISTLGLLATRFLLRQSDGTYIDPGAPASVIASSFGWGQNIYDYDNDGDQDILYHGGMDFGPFVDASNSGVLWSNQGCTADFTANRTHESATDHRRRNVHGMATGDFDNNGFMDIVSVSNFDIPQDVSLKQWGALYGGPYDDTGWVETFIATPPFGPGTPVDQFALKWNPATHLALTDGTLSVELNNGENGNNWIKVDTVGTVGITDDGVVNRDGYGAVIHFKPKNMPQTLKPVVSGESYASSHSDVIGFGMADERSARIDVLWPGGVRNRLHFAKKNRTVTFPEIPCSIDAQDMNFVQYLHCVNTSLNDIKAAKLITRYQKMKFKLSAIIAWFEEH